MSTANSNFDNDPFPIFTPRNNVQLGTRSPIQQPQSNLNMASGIQAAPFSVGSNAFRPSGQLQQSQQNFVGNMRSPGNPVRNQFQQQLGNDANNINRQLLASMVQNISLNPIQSQQSVVLNTPQTPLINNLRTPSITPPPMSQLNSQQTPSNNQQQNLNQNVNIQMSSSANSLSHIQPHHQPHHSNAHRKLFASSMDNSNSHIVNNNEMMMMSQSQPFQQPATSDMTSEMSRIASKDLSNIFHLKRSDSYFMSDELRSELIRKNIIAMSVTPQDVIMQLPSQVKDYTNLVPLDNQQMNIEHKSRTYSCQTISYKATHIKTNCVYYLKRIIGFRYLNQRCAEIVEMWKKIQHANICTLRDVFGTKEFNGEHSIIFVYDYYPGLETLQYRLYNNPNINLKGWANPYNLDGAARPFSAGKTINGSRSLGLLPEQNVWEYVVQLASMIRSVHSANLAVRIVMPSRILVDHKSRLRLSGVGIFDVLDQENNPASIAQHQQEDLVEFGRLVLALACNSLIAIQKEHINISVEIMNRNYSNDLRNLISHFMTPASTAANERTKSINDAMGFIGPRIYSVLDNAYTRGDVIENDLSKEIENGRLFRLVCKMNSVLERQEFNGDVQWSETGDRYMLKLFRDYVFHQMTPNGQPWIDLSHIVQCLNKFDTGSNEKIYLVSPDSQNIMIVSYAQLKKCFDKVFSEMTAAMNT